MWNNYFFQLLAGWLFTFPMNMSLSLSFFFFPPLTPSPPPFAPFLPLSFPLKNIFMHAVSKKKKNNKKNQSEGPVIRAIPLAMS